MDKTWWRATRELDDDQRGLIEIPIDHGNFLIQGPREAERRMCFSLG